MQSKFNTLIENVIANTWPMPGNAYIQQSRPTNSVSQIIPSAPDTDPMGIIKSLPSFGTPLENVADRYANVIIAIEIVKQMLVSAKSNPVYLDRDVQQKSLDLQIQNLTQIEKQLGDSIKGLTELSLDSFVKDNKIQR